MVGSVTSSGFASGDRVIVGDWSASPIGPFVDVIWTGPDDLKVLFTTSDRVARFVSSVYRVDRIEIVPVVLDRSDRGLGVVVGNRDLSFRWGRGLRFGVRRPRWVTRWLEDPVARVGLKVRTYGVTSTGVRVWYQARAFQRLRASASVGGRDLGPGAPFLPAAHFGFTDPTRRPARTTLTVRLQDPEGRLDGVVANPLA
jgi:hypothetical protein